jgi:hypothetical protein
MSGLGLGDGVQNVLVIAIVALAVWCFFSIVSFGRTRPSAPRRRYHPSARYGAWRPPVEKKAPFGGKSVAFDPAEVGHQLNAVMAASFERRRLLSFSEYRVFKIIEDELAALRQGYRVFAQTSLGQILGSPDNNAFRSINSKRVDILVIDREGWPVIAVEYQGKGHYQGTAAARDTIKKEALRKAGVRYLEIVETDGDEQIRCRLREQLAQTAVPSAKDGESLDPVPSFGRRRNAASN